MFQRPVATFGAVWDDVGASMVDVVFLEGTQSQVTLYRWGFGPSFGATWG